MTEQWSLTEPVDGIPEPTPDELVQLRAEVRRIRALGPSGPDDFDATMAELKRLSREGGAYRPQHSGEAT